MPVPVHHHHATAAADSPLNLEVQQLRSAGAGRLDRARSPRPLTLRLVEAMTTMPSFPSKPSISLSSWLRVASRSCVAPDVSLEPLDGFRGRIFTLLYNVSHVEGYLVPVVAKLGAGS